MVDCEPQYFQGTPQSNYQLSLSNVFGFSATSRKNSGGSYYCKNNVGQRVPCVSDVTQIMDGKNEEEIPVPSL